MVTEEIEKKLTAYRRGSKFWRMLIFCQVRKRSRAFGHRPRPQGVCRPRPQTAPLHVVVFTVVDPKF